MQGKKRSWEWFHTYSSVANSLGYGFPSSGLEIWLSVQMSCCPFPTQIDPCMGKVWHCDHGLEQKWGGFVVQTWMMWSWLELLVPQTGKVQCLNIFANMFSCLSWNLFSAALCHCFYPCKNKKIILNQNNRSFSMCNRSQKRQTVDT